MTDRTTAIVIPAMRSRLIGPLVDSIRANTREHPYSIYFVVGDDECQEQCELAGVDFLRDQGNTWGHRLNLVAALIEEPYLFAAADDVLFHPRWLSQAHSALGNLQGVCSVNDLLNPEGTLFLLDMRYYRDPGCCIDTPGVVIYPGYHHNYSETELYELARKRRRWIKSEDSIVEHRHYINGKASMDDVYFKGIEWLPQDTELFHARRPLWEAL